MGATSVLFFIIFFVPLVALLIWIMRQDKRKGRLGLLVLGLMVIIGLWLVYMMTRGK